MKKNTSLTIGLILSFTFVVFIPNLTFGQMPGVSPSMMSTFTNMSPSAQRKLAKQYGIDISDYGLQSDEEGPIAQSSNSKNDSQVVDRTTLKLQKNKKKALEYKKKNVPIFERDYLSIDQLPTYGQFLFEGKFSTFSNADNAPVPNDYVIGVGDSLRILLYGIEDDEFTLKVNREGAIDFPELGSLTLAGMTFSDARDYIKDRVSKQMIGVDLNISIGRLRAINVFMAGEASIPGSYSVSGLSTVSQLLFVAGGITDIGSLRNIQVKRANKTIATFDLYKLLTSGNIEGDIRLQSGDVIFIPAIQKRVYIDGAVRRPGKYELKEDETLSDLLELVGGLESRAYMKQVSIERYNIKTNIPLVTNLNLTLANNLNFDLNDGDIIRIPEVSDNLSSSITLKGAIRRPGNYGWYEGIKFTDIINSIDTDFSANFDMKKGLIIRRKNSNNYDIEVLGFSIKDALENSGSKLDPELELYDQVLIFSLGLAAGSNDFEKYDPKTDTEHPWFGMDDPLNNNQATEISAPQMMNPQMMNPQMMNMGMMGASSKRLDLMSDDELEVKLYESRKELEYNIINKGKRRILLKPIIKKLLEQATSSESTKIVSISGAVKIPGDYPLINNATYFDLIELAGGFADNANIESVELRRTTIGSIDSMVVETTDIDLSSLGNLNLESRDHMHVRNIKDWDATDFVILSGEVFYPGSYLISPNETLSSVIRRAGGFTSESFIEGAVFTRDSIKQKEREQLQILGDAIRRDQAARSMTKESEDFLVNSNEVEASITALLSTEVYGRLIVDIPRLLNGDSTADIVLQDGDFLVIPKFTNAVTVVGEVRRAGSFVRQDSYNINDYLQLAAGMTARGDKKEIYVIRANGSVEKDISTRSFLSFDGSANEILAGDTIVIPIKSSYQTPLNLYSTVSQVVFQSIASIAAFTTVLK